MPAWGAGCGFLEDFWDVVIRAKPGRTWRIATLSNPDTGIDIRDPVAFRTVEKRLDQRNDVESHYYRAWVSEPGQAPPRRDYLFIGRLAPYLFGRAAAFAHPLGGHAHARFEEDRRGRSARTLRYGDRCFYKREIDEGYRRLERDFGVLMFRRHLVEGEEVWLVALAGLTFAATWALAHVLADADERAELARQVRGVLPKDCAARFDEAFEVCVQFDFDKQRWANLGNEPDFEFTVEVVTGGADVFLRSGPVELVLRPAPGNDSKLFGGGRETDVPKMQAALMRRLIEAGEHGVPMSGLIDEYLAVRDLSVDGKHGARANREQLEAADNAERKRVHDLNNTIGKVAKGWRPVEKVDGRYVLQAKARIDTKENG